MDLGLNGRVCVVTGGSRGIGAATVELLRAEGAQVFSVSRTGGNKPGDITVDVTAPDAPELILRQAGRIDVLVNNAGTSFACDVDALTDLDWAAQYELHVLAPMRLMRAFAPPMRRRGWGRIVNVCSSAAKQPSQTNLAYTTSKAALLSLSRAFADRYAAQGVAINAVLPGPVLTELWTEPGGLAEQTGSAGEAEATLRARARRIPIGRFGESLEIARVIAVLCSEAASNVVGAAWSVDGGSTSQIY